MTRPKHITAHWPMTASVSVLAIFCVSEAWRFPLGSVVAFPVIELAAEKEDVKQSIGKLEFA